MSDHSGKTVTLTSLTFNWASRSSYMPNHAATAEIDGQPIEVRVLESAREKFVRAGYRDIEWTTRDTLIVSIPVVIEKRERADTHYCVRSVPPRDDDKIKPMRGIDLQPGMVVNGTNGPVTTSELRRGGKYEVVRLYTDEHSKPYAEIKTVWDGRTGNIRLHDDVICYVERASIPVSV